MTEKWASTPPPRPKKLALELIAAFTQRIQTGDLPVGSKLPTELEIVTQFTVSRTVVREALSKLEASGLVQTRHGIGTFVLGVAREQTFSIAPERYETLRDVIAVMELRIGVEIEAAGLAALRRTPEHLANMRAAMASFEFAIENGQDAVASDFQFHLEIARATQNEHFIKLLTALGTLIIPRSRLDPDEAIGVQRQEFLRRVNSEHASICDAIANSDVESARAAMRTHLVNSRERRRRATPSNN